MAPSPIPSSQILSGKIVNVSRSGKGRTLSPHDKENPGHGNHHHISCLLVFRSTAALCSPSRNVKQIFLSDEEAHRCTVMAISSQHWRHASRTVAATLAVMIFIGCADATTCSYDNQCTAKDNAIAKCTEGQCTYSCKAGWSNCDNSWSNGCERDLQNDVNFCGSCALQCIPYHAETVITKCIKGTCTYTCKAGLSDCNDWLRDGCESRLPYNDDLRFCGACDTPCLMSLPNADSKCNKGKCEYTCHPGWGNCDNDWTNGCEQDLWSDMSNCGKCSKKCSKSKVPANSALYGCNVGECIYECKPGFQNCDRTMANGCETNVKTNINHCGECDKKCPSTLRYGERTCRNGYCGEQCMQGKRYDSVRKICV